MEFIDSLYRVIGILNRHFTSYIHDTWTNNIKSFDLLYPLKSKGDVNKFNELTIKQS